jgi:hypothetical protein
VSDVFSRFTIIFMISRKQGSIIWSSSSYVNSMYLGCGGVISALQFPGCNIILLVVIPNPNLLTRLESA